MILKYENLVHHELLEHLDEYDYEISEGYVSLKDCDGYSYCPDISLSEVLKSIHQDHLTAMAFDMPGFTSLDYEIIVNTPYDREIEYQVSLRSNMTIEEAKAIVLARKEADLLEVIVKQCFDNSKKRETL